MMQQEDIVACSIPEVKNLSIYNFIANHMVDVNDPQCAFKSLDGYRMVVSSGIISTSYAQISHIYE